MRKHPGFFGIGGQYHTYCGIGMGSGCGERDHCLRQIPMLLQKLWDRQRQLTTGLTCGQTSTTPR